MPLPDAPTISVVVPCRNEGRTLRACLDALEKQDHPAYEVLLVDGHSTDGCLELARSRGHPTLVDPGRGPAAARNLGIRHARAPIVAFTDADCIPFPDWLTRLQAAFDREPGVAGVAGGMRMPRRTLVGRLEDNDARVRYAGFITSNVAYRRDVLLAVGGFDERLVCAEDYDLAWRVIDAGHAITRDPAALVIHDAPEVSSRVVDHLRKQFWYARHDVLTHTFALHRVRRAPQRLPGSRQAARGMLDAFTGAGLAFATGAGLAARSPLVLAGALGGAFAAGLTRVRSTLRAAGEASDELVPMALVETARRFARGAGTIVGGAEALAQLARGAMRETIAATP